MKDELLIAISTYRRVQKLKRLLTSLNQQTYQKFKICIIADANDLSVLANIKIEGNIKVIWTQYEHKYVIGCWNRAVKDEFIINNYKYFFGAVDDIELYPNTLEEIVKLHKDKFPDTDGVVGFTQVCPDNIQYTYRQFGQTVMGRKFIERYKEVNYQICCPHYKFLYQDEEMYRYADSLNKFFHSKTAILNHYHPCFVPEEMDETHRVTREGPNSPKSHDIELYNKRKKEGKVWGLTWDK